jgi:methylmalonyl-CoA mutase N-terminal domain/subunit
MLTNTVEREAEEILLRIERAGGTLAAIETGLIQREVQESAFRAQQAIDQGRAIVVGVNKFTEQSASEKDSRPLFHVDAAVEARQIARLHALRASRDVGAWREALAGVSRAASDGSNLVPAVIAAVEARATIGEIADAMRAVFGEFEERR